mmetsp:Transcript_144568/g.376259  ORF Transcript_144568/g.376259 Transcript_144568/m.376259 type:complete len:287 (+) Transcript_144568:78-938(+)
MIASPSPYTSPRRPDTTVGALQNLGLRFAPLTLPAARHAGYGSSCCGGLRRSTDGSRATCTQLGASPALQVANDPSVVCILWLFPSSLLHQLCRRWQQAGRWQVFLKHLRRNPAVLRHQWQLKAVSEAPAEHLLWQPLLGLQAPAARAINGIDGHRGVDAKALQGQKALMPEEQVRDVQRIVYSLDCVPSAHRSAPHHLLRKGLNHGHDALGGGVAVCTQHACQATRCGPLGPSANRAVHEVHTEPLPERCRQALGGRGLPRGAGDEAGLLPKVRRQLLGHRGVLV